jgi:hypothetical protein
MRWRPEFAAGERIGDVCLPVVIPTAAGREPRPRWRKPTAQEEWGARRLPFLPPSAWPWPGAFPARALPASFPRRLWTPLAASARGERPIVAIPRGIATPAAERPGCYEAGLVKAEGGLVGFFLKQCLGESGAREGAGWEAPGGVRVRRHRRVREGLRPWLGPVARLMHGRRRPGTNCYPVYRRGGDKMTNPRLFLGPGGKGGGPGRYHLQRREGNSQPGLRTRSGTAKVTTGENWKGTSGPWGQLAGAKRRPSCAGSARPVASRHRSMARRRATATIALRRERPSRAAWSRRSGGYWGWGAARSGQAVNRYSLPCCPGFAACT